MERSPQDLEARRAERHEARQTQTYKIFLKHLCALGALEEELAERAALSVLCALEQRLLGDEAAHLNAQLPARLRELLVRCERHHGQKPLKFGREAFISMVCADLELPPEEAERLIRTVLAAVRHQVSEGELEDVLGQLPQDLRELWQRPS